VRERRERDRERERECGKYTTKYINRETKSESTKYNKSKIK